nr:immunoglobulin heavy chain junction region [Mus musculus]
CARQGIYYDYDYFDYW